MDLKVKVLISLLVVLGLLLALMILLPAPVEAQEPAWEVYYSRMKVAGREGDTEMVRAWAAFSAYEIKKAHEWKRVDMRPNKLHDQGWWWRDRRDK